MDEIGSIDFEKLRILIFKKISYRQLTIRHFLIHDNHYVRFGFLEPTFEQNFIVIVVADFKKIVILFSSLRTLTVVLN